jgi:Ca2+/Na+ antiporter
MTIGSNIDIILIVAASLAGFVVGLGAWRRDELLVTSGLLGGFVLALVPLARASPGGARFFAALVPVLVFVVIIVLLLGARRRYRVSLAALMACRYERKRMLLDTLGFAASLILLVTGILLAAVASTKTARGGELERAIAASAILIALGTPTLYYAFKDYLERCMPRMKKYATTRAATT